MFFILPAPPGVDPFTWLLTNIAFILVVIIMVSGATVFYKWLLKRRKTEPRNPRLPTKIKIKNNEIEQEGNA